MGGRLLRPRIFQVCAVALLALLVAAYANHFHNGFHFDDSHAILQNGYVRDLHHVARYFTDATTFSVLPQNQSYRPVLQTTLAMDYWAASGYKASIFQIDTFIWYIAQVVLTLGLFVTIARQSAPEDSAAPFAALFAAGLYALHPACAETVNYIIQRGDLLATAGVVGGLVIYARAPRFRRWGLYLVPVAVGALAKQTALVFPVLLFTYVRLFERRPVADALRRAAPSIVLAVVLAWWTQNRTPPTWAAGGGTAPLYWLTQTFVALRYAAAFFAPIDLSADNDWRLLNGATDPRSIVGVLFIAALAWTALRTARRPDITPISFGLWWFLIALLPTSVMPLAEVANDHRMFMPFVGLALAVGWTMFRWARPAHRTAAFRLAMVGVIAAVFWAEAIGVHARNEVWRSDETLWYDVTIKSPMNGRGLMNYGLTRMERGDYQTAIAYFERALALSTGYPLLHINLGIAYGGIGRGMDAEKEFLAAIALAPVDWRSHYYYARWLRSEGRGPEAIAQLQLATSQNPADLDSRQLLDMAVGELARTPESYLSLSFAQYRAGRLRDCIDSARAALTLRPDYAEAYNNIAAGYNSLGEWDKGIAAAEQAIRLKADFPLARNNLAWALQQKQRVK